MGYEKHLRVDHYMNKFTSGYSHINEIEEKIAQSGYGKLSVATLLLKYHLPP